MDIDPKAVDVAYENAALNGIGRDRYTVRAGDILSDRALAAQLAINPNTIQRAYRRLEAEGWIATVPGKGCFVCGDGEIREREKKRLLLSFDEAAAALLTMGASHGELVARIEKGDHRHA